MDKTKTIRAEVEEKQKILIKVQDVLTQVAHQKKVQKAQKHRLLIGLGLLSALSAIVAIIILTIENPMMLEQTFATSITLTTPAVLEVNHHEDIVIDVVVNEVPKHEFPAASISVHFDHDALEFIGVRQGNMVTRGDGGNYNIPIWHVDTSASNQHGIVNAMYLDTTGGEHPYIINESDILLRLIFRLQDEVQSGEIFHLVIDDAVLAAIDPAESVGIALGNMQAHHAQIIIR